jgi:hypothetical protein
MGSRRNQKKIMTELENVWNTETGELNSRGITLKSNTSFVSVYLQ